MKHSSDIQPVGTIRDTQIATEARGPNQNILIQDTHTGKHLVSLLGFDPARAQTVAVDAVTFWRLPHSDSLDGLIKELVDVLISIRYVHPTLTQLSLEMELVAD
jgi:hypothetical protein